MSGGPKPLRRGFKITPVPMQEYYLEICRWLDLKLPAVIKPRLFIGDDLQKHGDEILRKYGIEPHDKIIGSQSRREFWFVKMLAC